MVVKRWRQRREHRQLLASREILPSLMTRPNLGNPTQTPIPETPWVPVSKKEWEDLRIKLAVATGNVVIRENIEQQKPVHAPVPSQALPPLIETPLAQEAG